MSLKIQITPLLNFSSSDHLNLIVFSLINFFSIDDKYEDFHLVNFGIE